MTTLPWQLHQHRAQLRCGEFRAGIDLAQPERGLFDLGCRDGAGVAAQLLGIDLPSGKAGAGSLLESYVRGDDLVAAYLPADDWPVHVDARWRATGSSQGSAASLAVELVVSVRTELLDSRPQMAVASMVPSSEALRLADAAAGRFEPLALEAAGAQDGCGCILIRLPQADISYVEMVHPADCHQDELEVLAAGHGPMMRIAHRLFLDPLEKGVMLRGRVCGVLLPRAEDCRLAADWYREFAAAEPSLGG